jgi:hypothetical protein
MYLEYWQLNEVVMLHHLQLVIELEIEIVALAKKQQLFSVLDHLSKLIKQKTNDILICREYKHTIKRIIFDIICIKPIWT